MNRYEFEAMMRRYAIDKNIDINWMSIRLMYQRYCCGVCCDHVRAALNEVQHEPR